MFYVYEKDGEYKTIMASKKPSYAIAQVPPEIDRDDYEFLTVESNPEPFNPDSLEEYREWIVSVDEVKKGEKIAIDFNENEKARLYKEYLQSIDDQMILTFGTTNRDTANAKFLTWKEMISDPDTYADQGLFDDNGVEMTTFTAIFDYATAKIQRAKDYSIFLMKREKQYDDDIAQIS